MSARLAAQLYTLREFTKTAQEFEDALRMVHAIGYEGVQLSAVGCMNGETPEVDAKTAKRMLDEQGLVCCATHRPWKQLVETTDAEIEFHQTLECDYVAIGGIWDYGKTPDSYHRFLSDARPVIQKLTQAGLKFGFHNHHHEFIRNPETGKTCYDILIDECPELQMEIDVYWVAHAGADPAQLMARLPGRIDVIHAKDKEVVDPDGPVMAPVGEGNLNWDAILAAGEAGGTRWWVVEQDVCRRDPFECLASSFEFLAPRIG